MYTFTTPDRRRSTYLYIYIYIYTYNRSSFQSELVPVGAYSNRSLFQSDRLRRSAGSDALIPIGYSDFWL